MAAMILETPLQRGAFARVIPAPAFVSVEDEKGRLDASRAAAAVRGLDEEDDEGLLVRHMAEVEDALSAPLMLGNHARLLIDGPQTQEAMLRAMNEARLSIDVEAYILEPAGMGERMVPILKAKRARGVRVRILYDSVGSISTPSEYFDRLRAIGVDVCEFNPVSPLRLQVQRRLGINNRDHRKILVVDGRVAFTGGINISGVYSSSSFTRRRHATPKEGWRDTHVEVRGPVVKQFQMLYNDTWFNQRCANGTGRNANVLVPSERAGSMAVRLLAADPLAERSEFYGALLSAMEHARRRIWLTYGYFVPDEQVLQGLRAAAKRGVDVRLILPGFSDFWAPFYAGRFHYRSLLEAGVRIFERRDALLHAKTAVIDGLWCSVGSTNLDWRSFVHNYEADLLVLDKSFGNELARLFAVDEAAAHEIRADQWARRSFRERLLEWLAWPWSYLL